MLSERSKAPEDEVSRQDFFVVVSRYRRLVAGCRQRWKSWLLVDSDDIVRWSYSGVGSYWSFVSNPTKNQL